MLTLLSLLRDWQYSLLLWNPPGRPSRGCEFKYHTHRAVSLGVPCHLLPTTNHTRCVVVQSLTRHERYQWILARSLKIIRSSHNLEYNQNQAWVGWILLVMLPLITGEEIWHGALKVPQAIDTTYKIQTLNKQINKTDQIKYKNLQPILTLNIMQVVQITVLEILLCQVSLD